VAPLQSGGPSGAEIGWGRKNQKKEKAKFSISRPSGKEQYGKEDEVDTYLGFVTFTKGVGVIIQN